MGFDNFHRSDHKARFFVIIVSSFNKHSLKNSNNYVFQNYILLIYLTYAILYLGVW